MIFKECFLFYFEIERAFKKLLTMKFTRLLTTKLGIVYVENYPLPNLELRETQSAQLPNQQGKQKQQQQQRPLSGAAKDKPKGKKGAAVPVKTQPTSTTLDPPVADAAVAETVTDQPPARGQCCMFSQDSIELLGCKMSNILQRDRREANSLVCFFPALTQATLVGMIISKIIVVESNNQHTCLQRCRPDLTWTTFFPCNFAYSLRGPCSPLCRLCCNNYPMPS